MRLAALVAARQAWPNRPAWSAIFAKAYALVADEIAILRRAYVKLPTPHLYEYPLSKLSMVVEREYQGEMVVLTTLIRNPATGEMMKGAAKPASVRVKIRALSKLKSAAIS